MGGAHDVDQATTFPLACVVVLFEATRSRAEQMAVDDLERSRSWDELEARVVRLAHVVRDEWGVPPGGHLAMVVGNRVEFVELVLASLLSGTWITPVNTYLRPPEIDHVLRDSGAQVVVCDADHAPAVRDLVSGLAVVEVGDELDALVDGMSDEPLPIDGPAGATMFYTSGTTGRPKGVKRAKQPTVVEQMAALAAAGDVLGLDGAGPHLVTGPLHHAAPLGFAMMDLLQGAPVVIMPRWDAEHALTLIDERAVRDTHLVPTMCVRLLRLPDARRRAFDGSSLRTALHGAAPIAPAVKRRMIEWWGPVLVEYWGASEGGVVTLASSEEWLERPGTVGRPIPSYEVVVADDEGRELPPGEIGRLWCRHRRARRPFAYHHDESKTAAAYRDESTYTIGDLGRVDADGYVFLSDRASSVIISGGVNVYPAEVEAVLMEHPQVHDVVVVGVADDEWGETVKAVVEAPAAVPGRSGNDLATQLIAFARKRLAGFKVPRTVEIVDALPRHDNGKLALRDVEPR
jgi:long-chain acyl-CoA synthetase